MVYDPDMVGFFCTLMQRLHYVIF